MEADFNHSSTLKVKKLLIIHFSRADITEQLRYTHTHTLRHIMQHDRYWKLSGNEISFPGNTLHINEMKL